MTAPAYRVITEHLAALHAADRALSADLRAQIAGDPRMLATAIAAQAWGERFVVEQPAAINLGALAVQTKGRLVAHEIERGARRLVDETDLHALPDESPTLLRGPWVLEVRDPTTARLLETGLAGRPTVSLAGYPLDGAIYLVGRQYPDGITVARWTPKWTGEDIDAGVARDTSPLIDDVDAHHEWARDAARFAVVFGLLLDVAATPLRVYDPREAHRGKRSLRKGEKKPTPAWVTRRVLLDPDRKITERRPEPSGEGGDGPRSHLHAELRPVSGFLRRQPHGPDGSLRKLIYVPGFEARRWVAPRVRVIVKGPTRE